ncbi:MAG: hypothetical protein ACPG9K_01520 [Poseidonibacter sp.]
MKELTNYFTNKDIIFKQINSITPKEIGSRKKIGIYHATSIKKEFYSIFIVDAKSRFLRKNADDLMALNDTLSKHLDHNFKKKILLISSPLCSKAKAYLKENKWSVYIDFM